MKETEYEIEVLAQALYKINGNAKSAPDPRKLYELKRRAIQKLLAEGRAEKVGLHYSPHPRYPHRCDVLVRVSSFLFHVPASKEDYQTLPNLGHRDSKFRNPKVYMSLPRAKRIVLNYLGGIEEQREQHNSTNQTFLSTYLTTR